MVQPQSKLGAIIGIAVGVGTAMGVAIAANTADSPAEPEPPLAGREIVDLTHAFDESTIYWPTAPQGFRHEALSVGETEAGRFYAAFTFSAPEHGGTHMDAPYHFARNADSMEEVAPERLIGPAVVIDVSDKAEENRDYRLKTADIRAFEERHGRIPDGAILLLRTGWGKHWPEKEAYLGGRRADDLHFPSFGESALRFVIEKRDIAAFGVDTASTDAGESEDFPVHRLASKHNLPGFENLANLGALPPTGAFVAALPMKIAGGSGAPLRAVAFLPKDGEGP